MWEFLSDTWLIGQPDHKHDNWISKLQMRWAIRILRPLLGQRRNLQGSKSTEHVSPRILHTILKQVEGTVLLIGLFQWRIKEYVLSAAEVWVDE